MRLEYLLALFALFRRRRAIKSPKISFVVPCFNYGRFLPDCLNGIFSQSGSYDNLEVVAIDDCSSDDTWDVLNNWDDSRVKLIRHAQNKGHVFTVNEGLSMATGDFVARIDPDDRYRPQFLETLIPLFENDRVGFAYGDAAMIDAKGNITAERCPQPHGGQAFVGSALIDILHKNYVCAPTAIARREAWTKHLPIWEGLSFNDIYFNMMIARDWHFAYQPTVVADYRVHGSNHHTHITINKSEEPSLIRVLDWIFSHEESNPDMEKMKQRARSGVYSAHYLDLAEKYFGAGHGRDARRCYYRAVLQSPDKLFYSGVLRRFIATHVGVKRYNSMKSWIRRVQGK